MFSHFLKFVFDCCFFFICLFCFFVRFLFCIFVGLPYFFLFLFCILDEILFLECFRFYVVFCVLDETFCLFFGGRGGKEMNLWDGLLVACFSLLFGLFWMHWVALFRQARRRNRGLLGLTTRVSSTGVLKKGSLQVLLKTFKNTPY